MAFEITIPRLGWSMEEGTFVRWLKRDGDLVKPGDALFELEGEKAAQDVEAVDGGVLRIPANAPAPGSIIAVGAVIGHLVARGEVAPSEGAQTIQPLGESSPSSDSNIAPDVASSVGQSALHRENLPTTESVVASPRARRIAAELGVDWKELNGSGRNGRVRERDVRAATAENPFHQALSSQGWGKGTNESDAVTPLSKHRRTIASRMLMSQQQTAAVTLTTRVDATNLVALRKQFKVTGGDAAIPSYNDIVLKLVATVLLKYKLLAARWSGDHVQLPNTLNIGFAVDTEEGLVVPVVRDVAARTLIEVAVESSRLIERARAGRLTAAEMQDGVFTITNLGNFGIDGFTPIINSPESAILGLGRIRTEAVVYEGQIVARDQITLSLTFDHRLIDGSPAARFLQAVGVAIENPSASLLSDSAARFE